MNNTSSTDQAIELTRKGYCCISNKHLRIGRIDREDWVEVLAEHMMRPTQEVRQLITEQPGAYEDFYRRVLSKDKLTVEHRVYVKIPASGHNSTGYCK